MTLSEIANAMLAELKDLEKSIGCHVEIKRQFRFKNEELKGFELKISLGRFKDEAEE